MSTSCSATKSSNTQPSPSTACGSQSQGKSSEGNWSAPLDSPEQYEQFVEVDVEQMYLSDNENANENDDPSVEVEGIELEHVSEPTVVSESEHTISYDPENPTIELNALFPDGDAFKKALRQFAIKNEFEYNTVKSDKKRFIGNCKHSDCIWRIRAHRLRDDNKTFKVTMLPYTHTCPTTSMVEGRMTTKSWVADRASDWIRKNPSVGPKAVQNKLQDDFHVKLSYGKAWRGTQAALQQIQGSWENSFKLVYNFKAELEAKCPGSIVEVECEKDGSIMRFSKMFVALKPCTNGFLVGCRPYLGIDSTHLNGKYRGQLAAACGIDGHNWLFPVAYGIFDLETNENWKWFCIQLKRAIGSPPGLTISSDASKGLEKAVATVFPDAEHRECFRHLMENFKKRFHGELYDKNMKPAAYAYTREECRIHLEAIKKESASAINYLDACHKALWCRSMFSTTSKCDYVTNNISECFNAWIKDLKDLHITELVNQIRRRIMVMFDRRRKVGLKIKGAIMPSVMKKLHAKSRALGRPSICRGGDTCAEVSGIDSKGNSWTHAVELDKQECTCGEWQLSGQPCGHATAFICSLRGSRLEDYVHEYYSVARFKDAYAGVIRPIGDKSKWIVADPDFSVYPPKAKRPAGRPRKERILGCLELGTKKQQCKRCKGFGHQARTCKEPEDGSSTNRNSNTKRKRRSKVNAGVNLEQNNIIETTSTIE